MKFGKDTTNKKEQPFVLRLIDSSSNVLNFPSSFMNEYDQEETTKQSRKVGWDLCVTNLQQSIICRKFKKIADIW